MADRAVLLSAVDALDGILERWRADLRSKPTEEELPRILAAGALSRCCGLLRSAAAIIRADEEEGVGHLARGAWETALVGMYVLLDGRRGVVRLNAEQARQELALVDANGLEDRARAVLVERMDDLRRAEAERLASIGRPVAEGAQVTFERIRIEGLAREVGPLLVEAGLEEGANVLAIYHLLYRPHSAYDTHGLAAIERHLVLDGDSDFGLHDHPTGWIEPHTAVGIVTMFGTLLAKYVFDAFALDAAEGEADELLDSLHQNLSPTTGT